MEHRPLTWRDKNSLANVQAAQLCSTGWDVRLALHFSSYIYSVHPLSTLWLLYALDITFTETSSIIMSKPTTSAAWKNRDTWHLRTPPAPSPDLFWPIASPFLTPAISNKLEQPTRCCNGGGTFTSFKTQFSPIFSKGINPKKSIKQGQEYVIHVEPNTKGSSCIWQNLALSSYLTLPNSYIEKSLDNLKENQMNLGVYKYNGNTSNHLTLLTQLSAKGYLALMEFQTHLAPLRNWQGKGV